MYLGPCKGSLIYNMNRKAIKTKKINKTYKFTSFNSMNCIQNIDLDDDDYDYVEMLNRTIYEDTYFTPFFDEDAFHESLFIDVYFESSDTEDEEIDFEMIDQ